jgi:hypothetical protein
LDATISETAIPAPMRLQRLRKGRSVTPAMGATIRLFLRMMEPILTFVCVVRVSAWRSPGPRKRRSFYTLRGDAG